MFIMMKVKDLLPYYLNYKVAIYDEDNEYGEMISTDKAKEKYGEYYVCTFNAYDEDSICINICK